MSTAKVRWNTVPLKQLHIETTKIIDASETYNNQGWYIHLAYQVDDTPIVVYSRRDTLYQLEIAKCTECLSRYYMHLPGNPEQVTRSIIEWVLEHTKYHKQAIPPVSSTKTTPMAVALKRIEDVEKQM